MRELNRTVWRLDMEQRNISGSIYSDAGRSNTRIAAKMPMSIAQAHSS